jgi:Tol biopolymer transport system component
MSVAAAGETLHFSGGSMRVPFHDPFYIGIAVCAHNKDRVETAVFSDVELTATPAAARQPFYSTIETITVASTDARVAHVAPGRIGSANWSPDGKSLVFNKEGRMYRVPVDGGKAETIDTGFAVHCNDNHGLSPDGNWLAISSDESRKRGVSAISIYVVTAAGGAARQVTRIMPAWFHGWSPDGKTLVFTVQVIDTLEIFTVAVEGGKTTQLTTVATNDGPEYSPDGKYIYFSSDRTGASQIWRMQPDGSGPEQVTSNDFSNRFPHLSPDGRQLAFLSETDSHDVTLRVMDLGNKTVRVLARFVGGPGAFAAPSWSPDSRRLAFVSYSE